MKYCCSCKLHKEDSDFHKSIKHDKGLSVRCKPCGIAYAKEWYKKNKDRKRSYDERRREEKRYLYRESAKRWRIANPGLKNSDTQKRRAKLRGACPSWANSFFIKEIYDLAARRTKSTGIKWAVDHIIPLRGKNVCGLHVENNLRVVPAIINLRKNNRFSLTDDGGIQ